MNETASMNRVLIWKEVRQIIPLMLMLLSVGATLIVLWSGGLMFHSMKLSFAGRYLPLILPALYAAGVGAVQIGQEKELRTIQWLSSLPITPRRLILTKFAVALGGLVVMWLSCFLLIGLIAASGLADKGFVPEIAYVDSNDTIYFPLHSAFILSCGILSAWKLKNTFASLLAIIPLACGPLLLVAGVDRLVRLRAGYLLDWQRSLLTNFVTAIIAILFTWLAYRIAYRSFEPAEPPKLKRRAIDWLDAWKPPQHSAALTQPFRYPLSSLIWQSIHHNRLVLSAISAMVLIGSICLASPSSSSFYFNDWGPLVGALGASWLGVFAFSGDGSDRRLRFLADRGASPTKVWLGRQLIGVSILSFGVLVFAAFSLTRFNRQDSTLNSVLSVGFVALLSFCIYSVSQWTSQLIRILTGAALLAPLLSIGLFTWFANALVGMRVPFWILILCGGLPLLATWLMMRRYMDGQRGFLVYLFSLLIVAPVLLLPMVYFAAQLAALPHMPAKTKARLLAEAKTLPRNMATPWEVTRKDKEWKPERNQDNTEREFTGADAIAVKDEYWIDPHDRLNLAELNDETPRPIYIQPDYIHDINHCAEYSLLLLSQSPDDEAANESVRRWIVDLTRLGKGLRLSDRCQDQNAADVVEIWLTQALSSELLATQRDRDFFKRAIELVSDREGRSQARRRAILLTWNSPNKESLYDRFRYLTLAGRTGSSSSIVYLFEDRMIEAFIDAALRMIEAGRQGNSTLEMRRELHRIAFDSRLEFEAGPYSDRMRVGSADAFTIGQLTSYQAMQWYAPWEADAERLRRKEVK